MARLSILQFDFIPAKFYLIFSLFIKNKQKDSFSKDGLIPGNRLDWIDVTNFL